MVYKFCIFFKVLKEKFKGEDNLLVVLIVDEVFGLFLEFMVFFFFMFMCFKYCVFSFNFRKFVKL